MIAGSPARHILRFAILLILTNVGQQLYMIADAAIVGRGDRKKLLTKQTQAKECVADEK